MWDPEDQHDLDEDWPAEDDATELVPCPHCGADIYEDAPQCPVCGDYVMPDTSEWTGKPIWYVLLALAGLAAVILILSGLAAIM